MIGVALGLAALFAVIVVAWRKAGRWRREAKRRGRSESTAIEISDYGEIDATAAAERCACGGRFSIRGEGSRHHLRVVKVECRVCEREQMIYFDVRHVRH
jgi:hypothetical protein